MSHECFEIDIEAHVAHIRFSRPEKRNSMIPAFWNELPSLVEELDSSGDVRVIVISSTGPHFTAGMDLSVFGASTSAENEKQPHPYTAALFYDIVQRLQRSFSCLEQARIPVLAAVQGGCIGAGVDLVSACDMRYATRDAFFCIQETNIAMTADVGTFPRLTHLMPDGLVRELAYTGRALSADEALQCGLVNTVHESQELMLEHVLSVAKSIAKKAPMAVYGCKKMILHSRDNTVAQTLDYVGLWNASFLDKSEIIESMRAAKEERAGDFTTLPPKPLAPDDTDIVLP
jgi:enoyl-CoA hydratase